MPKTNPTKTQAWKRLETHYESLKATQLIDLFKQQERVNLLSVSWEDFYVDFSKNRITSETVKLLTDLAHEAGLSQAKEAYFKGETINQTEGRAVLHTALRAAKVDAIQLDGVDLGKEVQQVKNQMKDFCQAVISGTKKGYTGKTFTDIVNIGIGGSDLGPVMVLEALAFYKNHLKVHFVSNVDGDHVQEVIKDLNPETTLFVVVSKTFTTQETLTNALTIKKWFLQTAPVDAITLHFAAVSTNLPMIKDFGIAQEHVFTMWDWVGGRFSLWSSVGLAIALGIGFENFEQLLLGAQKMDRHFKEAPPAQNIPTLMGLLSIWYNNFFKAETEAVIPYTQYLHRFPAYLQQGIMESNGKSVDRNGDKVTYQTGNIVWGEPGTNSQHAFFQLIHQGTKLIPAHFIGFKKPLYGDIDHHNKLMANFFAQTKALMLGKTKEEAQAELEQKNLSVEAIQDLLPFKVFEGNRPTTTFLIESLTPENLGSLIAAYEHKIFVEGVVWNIYSYDQWGVELGKQLASGILQDLEGKKTSEHDPSTNALITKYLI